MTIAESSALIREDNMDESRAMYRTRTAASLADLGQVLGEWSTKGHPEAEAAGKAGNSWFTPESITQSFAGIAHMLRPEALQQWLAGVMPTSEPKRIGIVMAGNLPLVGFHDLVCVLAAGHNATVKLSSQDEAMPKLVVAALAKIDPAMAAQVQFVERLKEIDAVIATGGDNTARYFHQYFGKYPHIIRRNRNSVAILSGQESQEEIEQLGADIFSYFGMGCRSVSTLFMPKSFALERLDKGWQAHMPLTMFHKYANNLDYYKSIYLLNQDTFWDLGMVLLKGSEGTASPIAVLNLVEYEQLEGIDAWVAKHQEGLQVITSRSAWYPDSIPFGQSQKPELWDYADKVDTISFLASL